MPSFFERLPDLLRQLSLSTTPYTALELWSRIQAAGWEPCVPVMFAELQGDDPDVKSLILGILAEEVEQVGTESTEQFFDTVERLLADDDRLLRMAAIHAVFDLRITTPTASTALRHIVCNDEPPLARQALLTLIELDESVVEEVASLLRGRPS